MTLFPCNECAKAIIQSGIKTIVYGSDKYDGTRLSMLQAYAECGGSAVLPVSATGRKIEIEV